MSDEVGEVEGVTSCGSFGNSVTVQLGHLRQRLACVYSSDVHGIKYKKQSKTASSATMCGANYSWSSWKLKRGAMRHHKALSGQPCEGGGCGL